MGLLDSFKIESNLPLVKINLDLINIKGLDSLSVPFKASLDKNYDRLSIFYNWLPNDNYKIELLPNALIDFWGNTHDTLRFRTETKSVTDYGNIFLQIIRDDHDPFILRDDPNRLHRLGSSLGMEKLQGDVLSTVHMDPLPLLVDPQ